ncbi:hypothetical protein [Methylibium petroleiphilum]|uniref:Uncharacterized protein n=1 Tax=Methylibium petroleiphilum (strain ATCC BAA-1232 / LMG 22953 / PM1) TaxID=420662 RepID=A2SMU8_METPP|nr:hypothetical protein [Methylibium petroleiphilum]ABM96887.1 hypothetical protein Mpe_B0108 [Methylibium petroleiphilum PM1]
MAEIVAQRVQISHRVCLDDQFDPRGPDGQGRNRLGLWSLSPTTRCELRPMTKPAALDTLRGMAKLGNPTAYGMCTYEGECTNCPRKLKARDPWRAEWCLREDLHGNVWMIGSVEAGFAGRGYCFSNWEKLLDEIEVPMLKRQQDATGFYWVAATSADTKAQLKEI